MSRAGATRPARPTLAAVARAELREATATHFRALCKQHGLPRPLTEHRFHPTRGWRFDYAWPDQRVALEVDGGVWTHGRHTRGAGWHRDTEKLNAAAALGWRLLRCTPDTLCAEPTLAVLRAALSAPAVAR